MINQELLNYIKQNLNEGKSLDVIKKSLFSGGGWKELDINEAVEELNSSVFNKIPQKPKKKRLRISLLWVQHWFQIFREPKTYGNIRLYPCCLFHPVRKQTGEI